MKLLALVVSLFASAVCAQMPITTNWWAGDYDQTHALMPSIVPAGDGTFQANVYWDIEPADDVTDFPVVDNIVVWWDPDRYVATMRATVNGTEFTGYLAHYSGGFSYQWLTDSAFVLYGGGGGHIINDPDLWDFSVMHHVLEEVYERSYADPAPFFFNLPGNFHVQLLASLGGGGDSGVDRNDWDFWYDRDNGKFTEWFGREGEEGKFDDIHQGLEYWLGGADDQPGALFTFQNLIFGELSIIRSVVGQIAAAVATDTIGTFEDTDFVNALDPSQFAGIIDPSEQTGDDMTGQFDDLGPEGNDSGSPPDMVFHLPFSQWFAGLFPSAADMTISIEMEPFEGVRNMLHVMFFAGVSVWGVLAVLGETRRT